MNFESNQEYLFELLKKELGKIHPNIVFEFSTLLDDSSREFIISADGVKETFPYVINLVKQSPIIKNWKIIAFRQSHINITEIRYDDFIVNLDDVFFTYEKENNKINLELHIKNFYESHEWTAATFILLDKLLGEYNTEMYIDFIDKKLLIEENKNKLYPIKNLLQIINNSILELSN